MSPTIRVQMKTLSLLRDEAKELEVPVGTVADLVIQQFFDALEEEEDFEEEEDEEDEDEED
jgi:hypothetical protein